jgi:adenylosuccinate lyase
MNTDQIYQSPFSWRYGSDALRQIWSENQKRKFWRKIWVALADVQSTFGLISPEQVAELRKYQDQVDLERSLEVEARIKHDLMAEIIVYGEQCPASEGVLHLGATSMDIKDNAAILQIQASLIILREQLERLLLEFAVKIEDYADLAVMGFTHLQPAEPTTLGYRFAQYGQDLLLSYKELMEFEAGLKGKGFTGAVGTSASFQALLGESNLPIFQKRMEDQLGLKFFPVVNQTYPRSQDYRLIGILAGLAATLYKFSFDLRFLQTPSVGELAESHGKDQVGSSAMPFKRNPIQAEKVTSLCRYLAQLPRTAWDNAAHSLLERTLDDSANRRIILPEALLAANEVIRVSIQLVRNLDIFQKNIEKNWSLYGPFAATEPLLMALTKAGASRQEMHEIIRGHAQTAWKEIQIGKRNPLLELIKNDQRIQKHLAGKKIAVSDLLDDYLGDAPDRARKMSRMIREEVS